MGLTAAIASSGPYGVMVNDMGWGFYLIYVKPYTRVGPYLIGILAGHLLYEAKRAKRRLPWVVVAVGWVGSAAIALAVVYGLADFYADHTKPSHIEDVLYLTFARCKFWERISFSSFGRIYR